MAKKDEASDEERWLAQIRQTPPSTDFGGGNGASAQPADPWGGPASAPEEFPDPFGVAAGPPPMPRGLPPVPPPHDAPPAMPPAPMPPNAGGYPPASVPMFGPPNPDAVPPAPMPQVNPSPPMPPAPMPQVNPPVPPAPMPQVNPPVPPAPMPQVNPPTPVDGSRWEQPDPFGDSAAPESVEPIDSMDGGFAPVGYEIPRLEQAPPSPSRGRHAMPDEDDEPEVSDPAGVPSLGELPAHARASQAPMGLIDQKMPELPSVPQLPANEPPLSELREQLRTLEEAAEATSEARDGLLSSLEHLTPLSTEILVARRVEYLPPEEADENGETSAPEDSEPVDEVRPSADVDEATPPSADVDDATLPSADVDDATLPSADTDEATLPSADVDDVPPASNPVDLLTHSGPVDVPSVSGPNGVADIHLGGDAPAPQFPQGLQSVTGTPGPPGPPQPAPMQGAPEPFAPPTPAGLPPVPQPAPPVPMGEAEPFPPAPGVPNGAAPFPPPPPAPMQGAPGPFAPQTPPGPPQPAPMQGAPEPFAPPTPPGPPAPMQGAPEPFAPPPTPPVSAAPGFPPAPGFPQAPDNFPPASPAMPNPPAMPTPSAPSDFMAPFAPSAPEGFPPAPPAGFSAPPAGFGAPAMGPPSTVSGTPTQPASIMPLDLNQAALVRTNKETPGSGWRKAVYKASFGGINPGLSKDETERQQLIERIRRPIRGCHKIAIVSLKGGIGKTTTTSCLGLTLAHYRGDRVVALDANPDAGTLAERLTGVTDVSVRTLLDNIDSVQSFTDISKYMSLESRLQVLASDQDPEVSEGFDAEQYTKVTDLLARYYNVILTDSGTGMLHSAMRGTLEQADSLVVVGAPSVDGSSRASKTLDWLVAHGYGNLVQNSVAVISSVREKSEAVDMNVLREHFNSRCRAVVEIPYDAHLVIGGRIDLSQIKSNTERAYLELAASVADGFA